MIGNWSERSVAVAGTLFAGLLLVHAGVGCDDGITTECVRESDCPSTHACSEGRCVPLLPDSGPQVLDAGSDSQPPDTAVAWDLPTNTSPKEDGGACGNNNGQVERGEILFNVPSQVTTETYNNLTIDLQGAQANGHVVWDLASQLPAGQPSTMAVQPIPAWAASDFPNASYVSQMIPNFGTLTQVALLGVFEVTPTKLQMVGLISDKPDHTKLSYSGSLDMLRFPIVLGDSYETSASVSGYSDIYPMVYFSESYTIDVLKRGKLKLIPNLTLDTLLVRVRQEVSNPFMWWFSVKTTAFLFVAECYGTVVRLIAEEDPGDDDLSQVKAEELWRLAAPSPTP